MSEIAVKTTYCGLFNIIERCTQCIPERYHYNIYYVYELLLFCNNPFYDEGWTQRLCTHLFWGIWGSLNICWPWYWNVQDVRLVYGTENWMEACWKTFAWRNKTNNEHHKSRQRPEQRPWCNIKKRPEKVTISCLESLQFGSKSKSQISVDGSALWSHVADLTEARMGKQDRGLKYSKEDKYGNLPLKPLDDI